MFNKFIGIFLIISAFVVEGMWLGACFGTVIVGIVLLIFAPGILLLPFNVLFAMGVGFLAYDKSAEAGYKSYHTNDFQYNSNNYNDTQEEVSVQNSQYGMKKYYDILGCSMDDSFETVRKAYKTLSREYHPDAVEGKGLDNAFVEFATQKMQEINEAYMQIKKQNAKYAV